MSRPVNATFHELQPAIGAIPGFAKFAAAAVVPWYSADSSVLRNAIVLLVSFIFLGAAVAVIAHKVDPRIYVASDVEHLLGFAPMAQLPDFTEVSDEVAEEHVLRLASCIDHAFKDRNLSHCVFTGTGRGVGVTTVAARVKEMLETLGESAVIAGAPEMSSAARGGGQQKTALHGDDMLKLRQLINEPEGARHEIILADSAPLTASEETEHLVRSADCAIVVIEAGVTTRAQLRSVASTLQRIKAPAVGFVLNRIRLATADAGFRRSIKEIDRKEMNRHLRTQGRSADWQMLQTLQHAIEEGSASLDLEAAPLNRLAGNLSATIAIDAAPLELVAPPEAPVATLQAAPALAAPAREPDSALDSVAEPADQTHQNQGPGNSENETGTEQDAAQLTPAENAHLTLPRLSELRGMNFTQALRDLDSVKHPAPPSEGVDVLMNAIAPFETLFSNSGSAQNGVLSAGRMRIGSAGCIAASFSAAEPGVAPGAENEAVSAKTHPPQPSLLPFKPSVPGRVRASAEKKAGGSGPDKMAPEKGQVAFQISCKFCLRGAANTKKRPEDRELQADFGGQ